MKNFLIIFLPVFLGCTYNHDTSDWHFGFIYFKADDTEYSFQNYSVVDQTGIRAYDREHHHSIEIFMDFLASGEYRIDSNNAHFYKFNESLGHFSSFGRTSDSISIAIDTAGKKITGHFEFWATNGRDTVFINKGAYIDYGGH